MNTFLYRAIDLSSQQTIEGAIEAVDDREARAELRSRGAMPLSVNAQGTGDANQALEAWIETLPFKRVKPAHLLIFTQQLAAMVEAGVPIIEALAIMERQAASPLLRRTVGAMRQDVAGGVMVSEAFARHPQVFSPLFVSLSHAGELSGALDVMLNRLAEMLEKNIELERKVRSALAYPALISCTLAVVVCIMLIFVVPTFGAIYMKAGATLPLPTRILLGTTKFFQFVWPFMPFLLLGSWLGYRTYRTSDAGRPVVDRLWLRLPLIGPLLLNQVANMFVRTFATVYGAGVPAVPAIASSRLLVSNVVIANLLAQVENDVQAGGQFSAGLQNSPFFPPMLAQMLAVGEASGKLEEMANKAVRFSDLEIDYRIKRMTAMLEPGLTVAMGIIVGFIALALYLPMFDLPHLMSHPH